MKGYIALFIAVVFGIVLSGVAVGAASTERALNLRAAGGLEPHLDEARDAIGDAYRLSGREGDLSGIRSSLETASLAVDRSIAAAVRFEVFKSGIFRSLFMNIILVALTAVFAGVILWYGTFLLFLKPLRKTAEEIRRAHDFSSMRPVVPSGCREMRFLQASVNDMFARIRDLESAVRESERRNIGRFLVHQLKNSLTPVKLCANNLKTLCGGVPSAEENLSLILEEVDRVESLLDRFRMLYKFPEPVRSEIELNEFARSLAARYGRLEAAASPGDILVTADGNLLEEAVRNLVENALDADPDGAVIVRTGTEPSPFLEVEDHGCGIPAENLERMFDEYFSTKPQGMGLGLPFVKKVLERHGFSLIVKSEPARGTTMRVEFGEKNTRSGD